MKGDRDYLVIANQKIPRIVDVRQGVGYKILTVANAQVTTST